jgi:hypothetical protein
MRGQQHSAAAGKVGYMEENLSGFLRAGVCNAASRVTPVLLFI